MTNRADSETYQAELQAAALVVCEIAKAIPKSFHASLAALPALANLGDAINCLRAVLDPELTD